LPAANGEEALVVVAGMADPGMKGGAIAHAYGLDECSLFPPARRRVRSSTAASSMEPSGRRRCRERVKAAALLGSGEWIARPTPG
jgi:hypothetical protein